jgi:hypothetical protein
MRMPTRLLIKTLENELKSNIQVSRVGVGVLLWTAAQETWPMGIAVRQSDRVGG